MNGSKEGFSLLIACFYLLGVIPKVWCDAKASYFDNLPNRMNRDSVFDYEDYSIHDSDTKIPGRHIPKRPYLNPLAEERPYLNPIEEERPYLNPIAEESKSEAYSPVDVEEGDRTTTLIQSYEDITNLPQGDELKPPLGPYFDRNLTRNLTVQAGKVALLSCRVNDISQKSVSWIRLRDLHILSVDKYKYSTDKRISVEYNESRGEWLLQILGAKHSDAGRYECQVSTKPVLSFIVNLDVVVPEAYIVNSPDIYVHLGSLINLTCVVNHGKSQPIYIYWYLQNKIVDIENDRRKVDMWSPSKGKTVSQLIVKKARLVDSGKYSCKPSNGEEALATLHVLKGELQAAMQTNVGVVISPFISFVLIVVSLSTL